MACCGSCSRGRGFTPCTWLTILSREDLIERADAVSAAKLSEIDDALRASEQRAEWTRPPPRLQTPTAAGLTSCRSR